MHTRGQSYTHAHTHRRIPAYGRACTGTDTHTHKPCEPPLRDLAGLSGRGGLPPPHPRGQAGGSAGSPLFLGQTERDAALPGVASAAGPARPGLSGERDRLLTADLQLCPREQKGGHPPCLRSPLVQAAGGRGVQAGACC